MAETEGIINENFSLALGYFKMIIGYVNFRNLSQSRPIYDPSHISICPCRSRPKDTSR